MGAVLGGIGPLIVGKIILYDKYAVVFSKLTTSPAVRRVEGRVKLPDEIKVHVSASPDVCASLVIDSFVP
jgi:hypothetical protein